MIAEGVFRWAEKGSLFKVQQANYPPNFLNMGFQCDWMYIRSQLESQNAYVEVLTLKMTIFGVKDIMKVK